MPDPHRAVDRRGRARHALAAGLKEDEGRSGRAPPSASAFLFSPALAFAYSYLLTYVPFVYAHLLFTLGYAAALGATVGALTRRGKMRNNAVGLFIAAAVSFASYYFSWAVWLSVLISDGEFSVSSFTLAAAPLGMWDVIQVINERGAWSIGRSRIPVTGGGLWAVWGAEALTVLIVSPLVAWKLLTAAPFCEPCQTWCAEEKGLVSLGAADSGELKLRCEAKDFPYLRAVGPKGEEDAEWYRLDLHRCPTCGRTNALSVQREKLKVDKKGNRSVDSKGLLKGLLLNEADVQQLRLLGAEAAEPRPAA